MSKRTPSCPGNRDLTAKAVEALAEAQNLPPGPERAQARKKAEKLRHARDTYNYLFSDELKPPE
ncbi:MAG TPA: hypothetical protein VKB08_07590 [Bradyrhizobium sp.]|nr:hypothetical protein [Bradyrhizobium sp.]